VPQPQQDTQLTLYHYCSTEAFRSIISNRTIWLSSLISSNDAMEGKWMTWVIGKVAEEEDLPAAQRALLNEMAEGIDQITDCLGLCMSVDGDRLSQWRGYADDGRGVSIGFNQQFLRTLAATNGPASLQQVAYDLDAQKQRVREIFPHIKKLAELGGLSPPRQGLLMVDAEFSERLADHKRYYRQIFDIIAGLQPIWFSFKNPAFREEQEWRLTVSVLPIDHTDYRAANGRLIPYQELQLDDYDIPPIDFIRLGPKHPTPPRIVTSFLIANGYEDVPVLPSDASYR
jgi:hypothetical protein